MKKMTALVLCLVLALSMFGCGTKTENGSTVAGGEDIPDNSEVVDTEKTQEADKETTDNNAPIEMSMVDGSYKDNKARFILKNNSDEEYTYGSDYALEERINGEWLEIVLDQPLFWKSIAFRLKPQSYNEFEVDFSFGYGELKEGTYRLCKGVCDKERNRSLMYAEFDIPELCELPVAPEEIAENTQETTTQEICNGVPLAPEGFAKP